MNVEPTRKATTSRRHAGAPKVARLCSGRQFVAVTTDPHAHLRDRVLQRVLEGAGDSDAVIRRAAADGEGLPADLQPLVDKIHRHAYKVTDDDIARLRSTYSDDQLFELVVSASLGASRTRLMAGLAALEGA
jgi:hypothetical protein